MTQAQRMNIAVWVMNRLGIEGVRKFDREGLKGLGVEMVKELVNDQLLDPRWIKIVSWEAHK